jgi:mRNA export factor
VLGGESAGVDERAVQTMQSPLKFQTRTIALFPNSQGYVLGSIEGRCAVQYINDADQSNNFRCVFVFLHIGELCV